MPIYLFKLDGDTTPYVGEFTNNIVGTVTEVDTGAEHILSVDAPEGALGDLESTLDLLGYTFLGISPTQLTGRRDFGRFSTANEPLPDVTGAITAVADASVGATAITSVTNSGGFARFNFTPGPTLLVNQDAVISGFTSNLDYNKTLPITATGAGFFETTLPFGTDETGSFLSNSVTVTSAAHGLLEGVRSVISGTTDYDGSFLIYDVQANTYRVNETFVATETGTWASGLARDGDIGFDTTKSSAVVFVGGAWLTSLTSSITFEDGSTQGVGAVRESLSWHPESSQLRGLFSVTVQDDLPKGIYLRADGLKLYMIGWESDDVNEYDLTTPWDLSSRSLLQTFSVAGKDNQPYTVVFKPDGTEFYIAGNQSKDFHQYTLATPWDVTSAVFTATSNPASVGHFQIAFRYDGKRIYSVGNSTTIRSYDLSTAWDLTSQSTGPSFVVAETLRGITFSPDGRSMFGCTATQLVEYDLTVPWDHTTAVLRSATASGESSLQCLIAKVDGEAFYSVQTSDDNIVEFSLGSVATGKTVAKGTLVIESSASFEENAGAIQYRDGSTQEHGTVPTNIAWQIDSATELQSFSLALQEPSGLYIRPDGLKMYITDTNGNNVSEFDLGTPWDVSTAVLLQASGLGATPEGIFFKPDGLRFWEVDGQFDNYTQYDLSTAWDISTKSQTADIDIGGSTGNDPRSSFWKPTGDTFYILNAANDTVFQLNVATPWDVDTSQGVSASFSVASEETAPTGLFLRSDGCMMYITGSTDLIHQYMLDTPWDVSTSRFVKSLDISGTNKQATGIFFKPDGSKAYYTNSDGGNDAVYELDVGISTTSVLIGGLAASVVAPTTVEVFTADDIDVLATAGVITVADGENLTLDLKADVTVSATRFALEGTAELRITSINADAVYLYSEAGSATFISGSAFRVSFNNIVLVDISGTGSTLVNLTSSSFNIQLCAVIGWADLGSLVGGTNFVIHQSQIEGAASGFTATDFAAIEHHNVGLVLGTMTGNYLDIAPNSIAGTVVLEKISGTVGASNALVRVGPGTINLPAIVGGCNIPDGTLFDTAGGATGVFTAVADASVALTTIDSVTDSSGVARFNFTVGPTLFVDQEVVISNFVTETSYNQTGIVTAVGAGFFEIASISFEGDDATGDFNSDSVTMTEAGTALVDGDTLVVDTDDATDYDGGATVYNQLTNTFQLNRLFTITKTGTWDTAGIDQTDPRVLASFNPGFADSAYIGSAFANGLSTATTGIVNGVFQDIAYGTVGAGLIAASTMERMKLIDEVNGTFEYTGNEPFCGEVASNSIVISSGGNQDFLTKWIVDRGPAYSGFVDLPDNVEDFADVGTTAQKMSQQQPVDLVKGDRIKKNVTRVAGTSTITFQYESLNLFK